MRRLCALLGCSIVSLALVACNATDSGTENGSSASSTVKTSSSKTVKTSVPAMEASSKQVVSSKKATARIITIAASNFAFSPNQIKVKKGEKVTLVFKGDEGVHGVMIADLGINVAIPAGETVSVELPTDKAGTFAFRCSIPCGPGHRDMTGTIVIE